MGDNANADLGAALRAALGAERCGRCDEAVLEYVASVLQDDEDACADVDSALEAVGPLLVRAPVFTVPPCAPAHAHASSSIHHHLLPG